MKNLLRNKFFLIDCSMAVLLAAMFVLVIIFLHFRILPAQEDSLHHGYHLLVLTPNAEGQLDECKSEMAPIIEKYDLQVEFVSLPTIADQKQMLSLIPVTDIDGVLFWPISIASYDYSAELLACRDKNIPVVLIDHDFDDKSLRNSFLGSGFNSDLMILNQTLMDLDKDLPIIIGGYSNSNDGDMYELLIFDRVPSSSFEPTQIQSERLRSFVDTPPNQYFVKDYIRITASPEEGITALNSSLYQAVQRASVTFSLDETLTNAFVMGVENGFLEKATLGTFIGYQRNISSGKAFNQGPVDKMLITDIPLSAKVGLIYLNDILRGFWVPSTFDSGIKLIIQ